MPKKKIGSSQITADFAGSYDGGTIATASTGTLPTPTQLRLGSDGTNYLNGWLTSVAFYNVAKSDSELQGLTGADLAVASGGGLVGSGAMGAYWADHDDRGTIVSRKRRKKFLEDRDRRIRDL